MRTFLLSLLLLLLQSPAVLACSSCVSNSGTEASITAYKVITVMLGGVPMLLMAAFILVWRHLQRRAVQDAQT